MRRCNTFAEGEHETIYWARIALKWCVIEYMSGVPMHPLALGAYCICYGFATI